MLYILAEYLRHSAEEDHRSVQKQAKIVPKKGSLQDGEGATQIDLDHSAFIAT